MFVFFRFFRTLKSETMTEHGQNKRNLGSAVYECFIIAFFSYTAIYPGQHLCVYVIIYYSIVPVAGHRHRRLRRIIIRVKSVHIYNIIIYNMIYRMRCKRSVVVLPSRPRGDRLQNSACGCVCAAPPISFRIQMFRATAAAAV